MVWRQKLRGRFRALSASWYEAFYGSQTGDLANVSRAQLEAYVEQAQNAGLGWTAS